VVDETSLREREKRGWLASVCSRVDAIRPLTRLDLFDGRRRFAFYAASVRSGQGAPGNPDDCVVWREAYRASIMPLGNRSGQGDPGIAK
jgi:hypothetical protein